MDITLTVLDILDIDAPGKIDGVEQMELHGASIFRTFNDPDAPDPRSTGFFGSHQSCRALPGKAKGVERALVV